MCENSEFNSVPLDLQIIISINYGNIRGAWFKLSRHTHFITSHATHVSTVQNRFKSMREPL